MTSKKLDTLLGGPARSHTEQLEKRHRDIAAALQQRTEDVVLALAREARSLTGSRNLCLAGGVALNCTANGRLLREKLFDAIFIQPAAGDSGGAIGAALYAYHRGTPRTMRLTTQPTTALGPEWNDAQIEEALHQYREEITWTKLSENELCARVADHLSHGQVLGWFQGRMEFGPRALGHRSILADPRIASQRDHINSSIKFREDFRPFAPAILLEHAADYFEMAVPSPFMLYTAPSRTDRLPSTTHIDGSSRLQTVDASNDRFHTLLKTFYAQTGCPALLNTSFNTRSEPIVCTPHQALECLISTNLDGVAIGSFLVAKRPKS